MSRHHVDPGHSGNRSFDHGFVVCGGCGARLETTIETDGWGGLIDVVKPCPNCRVSRIHIKPSATAPPHAPLSADEKAERRRRWNRESSQRRAAAKPFSTRVCVTCGEPYEWRRKPGRPPKYCDGCR